MYGKVQPGLLLFSGLNYFFWMPSDICWVDVDCDRVAEGPSAIREHRKSVLAAVGTNSQKSWVLFRGGCPFFLPGSWLPKLPKECTFSSFPCGVSAWTCRFERAHWAAVLASWTLCFEIDPSTCAKYLRYSGNYLGLGSLRASKNEVLCWNNTVDLCPVPALGLYSLYISNKTGCFHPVTFSVIVSSHFKMPTLSIWSKSTSYEAPLNVFIGNCSFWLAHLTDELQVLFLRSCPFGDILERC